ncbi:MAG: TolB protein [Thermomicrobiales bacterium]|nr:TolB protein [Thermomicrobiales bacterium]MEA2523921.1 TolB protein [Thermomicrobiales bacterium]
MIASRSPKLLSLRFAALLVVLASFGNLTASPAHGEDKHPPGRIAFVRKGDIWVWQNGKTERIIKDGAASDPRWSPTGRFVLFVRSGDSYSNLILYDLETDSETQLTFNQSDAQPGSPDYVATTSWVFDPDWTPTGLIGFASDATTDGSTILWLLPDPELSPEPAPAAGIEDDIEGVSLAADGSRAAYTVRARDKDGGNHTFVALRNLSDGTTTIVADKPGGAFDPAIAPDDGSVAVAIRADDGTSDIWLVDRAGGLTRVTSGAQATEPAWSPDGRWLAYIRMIDYSFELWAVPRDGDGFGKPQRLFRFKNLDATSRISWTLS